MPNLSDLVDLILAARTSGDVLVVGLTGGVASGKTTLAAALAEAMEARPGGLRVARASTDGFLFPNVALVAQGLLNRKGFPESYDRESMRVALASVRVRPTDFPGYSHRIYDVDDALTRIINPPDVLVLEGLGLDRRTDLDLLVYLDAEEADQEAWFVDRFRAFCEEARTDGASFYARFRGLDAEGVTKVAVAVWTTINRANLREHIAPLRDDADIVVTKGPGHEIIAIRARFATEGATP